MSVQAILFLPTERKVQLSTVHGLVFIIGVVTRKVMGCFIDDVPCRYFIELTICSERSHRTRWRRVVHLSLDAARR